MGKAIEKLATQKGHEIIGIAKDQDYLKNFEDTPDVAIEFTEPHAAPGNLLWCVAHQIPVVCGTTGWLQHWNKITEKFNQENGALFYASNFSLGVNLFFKLNQYLASLMSQHPIYRAHLTEIHHLEKKDAPSGTAIALAQQLIENHSGYHSWSSEDTTDQNILPIVSERKEGVPGTHILAYENIIDRVEIKHIAHSRLGFATGALSAAEWLPGRKGIFGMEDLLNINSQEIKHDD